MVALKDVIQITDKDILNAMAFTLYGMKYQKLLNANQKELDDLFDEILEEVDLNYNKKKKTRVTLGIGGYTLFEADKLDLLCTKLNFFRSSRYITDTFLVEETQQTYFKLGLLNEYDRKEFNRSGKLIEILKFLDELKFPYEWEYKKFFKLGCSYEGNKI